MKKITLVALVFAMVLSFGMGGSQKAEAGPFGSRGHWVAGGNGGFACSNHLWLNDCMVGDQIPADS